MLPNKLGHFNFWDFFFFLIRSWNFDLEHDGGVILAQMGRKGMKRGVESGRDSVQACFRTRATSPGCVRGKRAVGPQLALEQQWQSWGLEFRGAAVPPEARSARGPPTGPSMGSRYHGHGHGAQVDVGSGLGTLVEFSASEDALKLMAGCYSVWLKVCDVNTRVLPSSTATFPWQPGSAPASQQRP